MRKIVAASALFTLVLTLGLAPNASSQCGTQGAFALALVQSMGFGFTDQTAAIDKLNELNVKPAVNWSPDACMTEAIVRQIEAALDSAKAAGTLTAEQVAGAVSIALTSIGEEGLIASADRTVRGVAHVPT